MFQESILICSYLRYVGGIAKALLKSLKSRFDPILSNDVFIISSFLDPEFNIYSLQEFKQASVKDKVKEHLRLYIIPPNPTQPVIKRLITDPRYKRYGDNVASNSLSVGKHDDLMDKCISEYLLSATSTSLKALDFWKVHEQKFPGLAIMAKKFLGVPASSAQVERAFSLSGHILSVRRRRMGVKLFTDLVTLKLNEELL